MLLIGLGHKARHGKDTFAQSVADRFGDLLNIRLVSFADPLRAEVRQAAIDLYTKSFPHLPFDPDRALRHLCSICGVAYEPDAPADRDYPWGKQRRLHQFWGTEYRRSQDPRYWTKQAQTLIRKARAEGVDALFFRDMRFKNEYDLIGDEGGFRIKISRLNYVSDVPQHISETELDSFPFDLHVGVRDGMLEELRELSAFLFSLLWSKEQKLRDEASAPSRDEVPVAAAAH